MFHIKLNHILILTSVLFAYQFTKCGTSVTLKINPENATVLEVNPSKSQPASENTSATTTTTDPAELIHASGEEEDEESGGKLRPKRGYYYYEKYPERQPQKEGLSGRILRNFRKRTNKLVNAAGAIATAHEHYNDEDDDDDGDSEMAAGTWSRGGGHGHGGGGHGGYGKHVNKSAVGLLGFLSLLSLIQTALTTTTVATGGGRRKRETNPQTERITEILLPMLTLVTTAGEDKRIKISCVLNQVCISNEALVKEFGEHGKSVGIMMMDALTKMLKEKKRSSEEWMRVKYAGSAGRNKGNCTINYPPCDTN